MSDDENLFDIEPDWKETWRGMMPYDHQNLQPDSTLLVHFKTKQDRAAFARLINQTLNPKTKFVWHPKAVIGTAADKVFTGARVTPRYPVYIISKGRADSRLTSKALEWIGVPYHIVVEPQELAQYAAVIDSAKILVTPFSNLGQGGIPARNFVWEHAVSTGAARHWILDDNISGFCRFQDNLKVELDNAATFCAIEDWADRYENVVMCAMNYDYFAPRKQGAKIKPITLNTRCYSGILLRNDLPYRWRGRYNEDTDLSLRILKDGLCTALFNAFLMYKKPTLTMKGGNTDELYAGAEAFATEWEMHAAQCPTCQQCTDGYGSRVTPCDEGRVILSKDGRWLMAESLREQHPDCTSVERKWRRWQHSVDYRRFQVQLGLNVPKLREGVIIPEESEYELERVAMPEGDSGHNSTGHIAPHQAPAPGQPGPSALAFIQGLTVEPAKQPVPELSPEAQGKAPSLDSETFLASPGQPSELVDAASQLQASLAARGHRLLTRDGKFFVSEASRLTQEDREAIKACRAELVAMATPLVEDVAAAGVSRPADHAAERSATSLFEEKPTQTLAQFLSSEPPRVDSDYMPDEPPSLEGISDVVLNFATTGLDWAGGHRPCGVTVSTLDGQLTRFLPFAFAGGNLDEAAVKRWAERELRGKKILNAKTKFDVHHAREWGIDLEAQGCTFSDIQHTAALLDDHRKRFALDELAKEYFPDNPSVARVDERQHADHPASEVAERELYTARLVGRLRDVMYPEIDAQELRAVQDLEDAVIPSVVEMERNGSPIDVPLLEQYGKECSAAHDALMWEISREAGHAFEHTAKGWTKLLESLHLPVPGSFAESVLNEIDHPLVRKGQRASQYASLNSKIFKAYPEHIVDGVLRYEINQLASDDGGTVSGRFSIGLVQQVPNHTNHALVFGEDLFPRRLFVPGSGDFLEADAAQIEFRLLVHYSGNAKLLQAYRDDPRMSFHKTMQAQLMAYKPNMQYEHTKSYNFAAQYGARSIKLAIMMGFITEREGNEIRAAKRWNDPRLTLIHEIEAAYKKAHPEAGQLLDRASHLAKPACDDYCKKGDALHRQFPHRGYVKTMLGRRSRFPTNYKTYIGLNRILQGTGASIMKKKLIELHDARKDTGFVMRITNHDAVLGDVTTPETLGKVSAILNRQSYALKVPILWECGVGPTWADCK